MILTQISYIASKASKAFCGVACGVLAILVSIVVFQRFITNDTPQWAEELPRVVLVWSAFVGDVVCSRNRTHLMGGILPFLVQNPRVLAIVDRVNQALIALGLVTLAWAGWSLAQITMDQMLPGFPVSAGVVYLALPVGSIIAALVHLVQVFEPWPPAQPESLPFEV